MNLKALFREAFVTLTRNWLRSVLTILGISVGVAAFICVVGIGNAGSSRIEDQLQSLGNNFVWIEAGSRARNGMRAGARGTRSLVLSDAQAISEQVPLIKSMSPNVDGHVQVIYGGENWATRYRGVGPEYVQIRRWRMRLGTFFTKADVDGTVPVCVLGQTVVDNLFGSDDPIGSDHPNSESAMQSNRRPAGKRIFRHGSGPGRLRAPALHHSTEKNHGHFLAG